MSESEFDRGFRAAMDARDLEEKKIKPLEEQVELLARQVQQINEWRRDFMRAMRDVV